MAVRSIQTRTFIAVLMLACCEASADDLPLFGIPLQQALQTRRSLNVSETCVRDVCESLQSNTGIALLLDRRLDPSTRVSVNTDYATTRDVFKTFSGAVPLSSLSVTDFGVMIGPEPATSRLRTLLAIQREYVRDQRRKIEQDLYAAFVEPREVSWNDLASPRDLLTSHATEIGLTIANSERIPHDLWAAARLPSIPLFDFATLILNQFDLSFEIDGESQLRIIDVPTVVEIEKTHRVSPRDRKSVTENVKNILPDLDVTWSRSAVTASATVEVHEQLAEIIRGGSTVIVAAADLRDRKMTFKVPPGTQMGSLVISFRRQDIPIILEGRTDAELEPLLRQTVEFDLKSVPADEFFRTVFKSWNADVDVQDNQVVVRFAKK